MQCIMATKRLHELWAESLPSEYTLGRTGAVTVEDTPVAITRKLFNREWTGSTKTTNLFITESGGVYWNVIKTVLHNNEVYVFQYKHITGAQLHPVFTEILQNLVDCLVDDVNVVGIVRILDMNKTYLLSETQNNIEYEKRRAAEAELAAMREKVRAIVG